VREGKDPKKNVEKEQLRGEENKFLPFEDGHGREKKGWRGERTYDLVINLWAGVGGETMSARKRRENAKVNGLGGERKTLR